MDCCFADAGAFSDPDVLACTGDSSLLMKPDPVFANAMPDGSEYGYTYLISQSGILIP
ncbi:MAG: hypothetical protein IPN33_22760 [Saprospiraceae bacterium]|nr:hypothetical protein [Saprospiraceae bacterium]